MVEIEKLVWGIMEYFSWNKDASTNLTVKAQQLELTPHRTI